MLVHFVLEFLLKKAVLHPTCTKFIKKNFHLLLTVLKKLKYFPLSVKIHLDKTNLKKNLYVPQMSSTQFNVPLMEIDPSDEHQMQIANLTDSEEITDSEEENPEILNDSTMNVDGLLDSQNQSNFNQKWVASLSHIIHPFSSIAEFQIANWIWVNNIHQKAADSLLKIISRNDFNSESITVTNRNMVIDKIDQLFSDCVSLVFLYV
jgi:hypothetical protein